MGMRSEVQLPTAPIGYVRVELGRGEVGVAEHLLHAAQVGPALERVGREGGAREGGVEALRIEPGPLCERTQEQEGARARERPSSRVQEELRTVPRVEERPPVGEVAAERVRGLVRERDDPLLRALSDHADETPLEVDCSLLERKRLADPQPGAVEELDERAVAEGAWRRTRRRLDQPQRLAGGERPRQRPAPPRELERRR